MYISKTKFFKVMLKDLHQKKNVFKIYQVDNSHFILIKANIPFFITAVFLYN